ncbi:CopG family transcriptional regulator [Aphanothece hegewaldii CCALA 016]|uniref:CopG family transcriptional regulator n=1 Tax=Aphanothece hegewaldii CCALA 016 TaxID=2107694 RepID=A0A2T1LS99_9CHRO|nr:CopG family antitoxin [Aphanothece hegewaldii]PSF32486.1 CopG family transcriptional regulator [Aphanothece hegewaldii CCALA 016]
MKASEFDKKFDDGEDIIEYLDLSQAKRPQFNQINLDLPNWMVEKIEQEATRQGLTQQAILQNWIAEKLEQLQA